MKDVLMQTYIIALPILLGYIVWLLQEQKKKQVQDAKERDERIAEERKKRMQTAPVQCYFLGYS